MCWPFFFFLCFAATECTKDAPFRGRCNKVGRFTSPVQNFVLPGHVVYTLSVPSAMDCAFECLSRTQCASYNCEAADKVQLVCELNDKKAATLSELTSKPGYNYYGTQENLPEACASSPCVKSECVDSCVKGEGFQCICIEERYGDRCQYWKEGAENYDMLFDNATDYAELENTRSLYDFAICVWFKTQAQGWQTLFSQATDIEDNGLYLRCENMATCEFMFSGETRAFDLINPLNDGGWHHICVEHEDSNGLFRFSVDGAHRTEEQKNFAKSKYLTKGKFVLGQKLRVLGGAFDQPEGFVGTMTHFNVWDNLIGTAWLQSFAQHSCRNFLGDAVDWREFLLADKQGVVIQKPSVCQSKVPEIDFSFYFPTPDPSDYVTGPSLPALSHVTYCFWIRKSAATFTVFSYATEGILNALSFLIGGAHGCNMYIRDTNYHFNFVPLTDSLWHHVCVTWENAGGALECYLDGVQHYRNKPVKAGQLIPVGGKLHFGQRQNSYGGGHVWSSFGWLSGFNMWSRVLSYESLVALSNALGTEFGDVVSWRDLKPSIQGNVEIISGTRADKTEAMHSNFELEFTTRDISSYVTFLDMPTMTAFTACLWMKSSESTNTLALLSYALPGSSNEILVVYNTVYQEIRFSVGPGDWNSIRRTARASPVNDGWWHHLCVAWKNSDGTWRIWRQGEKKAEGSGFRTGHVIVKNGTLVIGQDQDTVGGGFQSSQSFKGSVAGLNIWDEVLVENSIYAQSRGLGLWNGNVLAWSALRYTARRAGSVYHRWEPSCRLAVITVKIRRNKYCQDNYDDSSCSGTWKALFDRKKTLVGKRWNCYKTQALKEAKQNQGDEYDQDKGLTCYKSTGALTDIT